MLAPGSDGWSWAWPRAGSSTCHGHEGPFPPQGLLFDLKDERKRSSCCTNAWGQLRAAQGSAHELWNKHRRGCGQRQG